MVECINYYQLTETDNEMKSIDGFLIRRLRMIRWRECKISQNWAKNLERLGMRRDRTWNTPIRVKVMLESLIL